MNYFYGLRNNIFKSKLQIPLFKNKLFKPSELLLFKCYASNNAWNLNEVKNRKINDYFYIIDGDDITNNDIFFLADKKIINNFNKNKLEDFNDFTNTDPAFRANLEISIKQGGYSSYQNEYPFSMVSKKGNILSPIFSLTNVNSDKNFIFIKNIIEEPVSNKFKAYLINYQTKKIEETFELKTNFTNCIELRKEIIRPEIFLITKEYMGVPMFVSVKNNFISFEHTHPPFEYILNKKYFSKLSDLKKEFNEIIG